MEASTISDKGVVNFGLKIYGIGGGEGEERRERRERGEKRERRENESAT